MHCGFHNREVSTTQFVGGGGGDSKVKGAGLHVVSLRGVNYGLWYPLLGIFSHQVT